MFRTSILTVSEEDGHRTVLGHLSRSCILSKVMDNTSIILLAYKYSLRAKTLHSPKSQQCKVIPLSPVKTHLHQVLSNGTCLSKNIFYIINPCQPRVPFLGSEQTVQTQIRCRRTRHLIRVFTVC